MISIRVTVMLVALLGEDMVAMGSQIADCRGELDKQGKVMINTSNMSASRAAALQICTLIASRRGGDVVTAELLEDLTRALSIDDNRVRYFAVRSLALIGRKAAVALPALRSLLEAERNPPPGTIRMGISPIPRIENAIEVIEGKTSLVRPPVSEECGQSAI